MADRPARPASLPGIPLRWEKLDNYMNRPTAHAWVYHPRSEEHLRRIFRYVRERGNCRVTFRGGAHSFDSQSQGNDIVISMAAFDNIEVLSNKRMRVGAGATWGAIVDELEPLGLMPKVTVTGSHASAGGTMSGDCLSRFSPAYGKEGEHIASFELMQLNGTLLTCTKPPAGKAPADWNLSERAFYGVIGGLGYLGAVTSITYEVHSLKEKSGPIGVRTRATTHTGFDAFAQDLVETMRVTYHEDSDPTKKGLDAVYGTIYVDPRGGEPSGIVWKSEITQDRERRPLAINQPDSLVHLVAEWAMRTRWGCRFGWKWLCNKIKDAEFIDDLDGYTFMMDGNARAKRIGNALGFKMQGIQQTFVVPNEPDLDVRDGLDKPMWNTGKEQLVRFLETAYARFKKDGLSPTLADVLLLPEDDRFLLSATEGRSGFVVSFAFETSNRAELGKAEHAFKYLSEELWEHFDNGRVYLVKNVHVDEATLADMYGRNAEAFFELKKAMDPQCLLRNDFLDRTFGGLLQCPDSLVAPAQTTVPEAVVEQEVARP
jgi:decaprenylphospho-beta-D-ribofuranose 2-oxidase